LLSALAAAGLIARRTSLPGTDSLLQIFLTLQTGQSALSG
jgi:hypothetical protein